MTDDAFHPAAPAVLFDLDGTLVDPAGAITGGITQALAQHELPVPPEAVLRAMVGPPLAASLTGIAGVPADRVADVIATYRHRYRTEGIAGSRVYPGMADLLERLRARGYRLAVATQKPVGLATELLAGTGLLPLVDVVHGASDDEDAAHQLTKSEIVAAALADLGLSSSPTRSAAPVPAVMVGDRRHDMAGAADNHLPGIGVAWGFAGDRELTDAGAAVVVRSAADLRRVIERMLPLGAERAEPADPADLMVIDAAGPGVRG